MTHHGHVRVILHGRITYIRASTISRYLPCLWRRYARRFPSTKSLYPVHYLNQVHQDQCTRSALRYLFEYLEEIDITAGKCTYLQESLDNAWFTHGPRRGRGKGTFIALGRILLPENFGCNKDIWSTMERFVRIHSNEIFESSSFDWVAYIRVLDEIDACKRFDLTKVIWCFSAFNDIRLQDLHNIHWIESLGPRPLRLLEKAIRLRASNAHKCEMGFGCPNCYNLAQHKRVSDLDWRRGGSYPWCFDGDLGPVDQCELCFRVLGPLFASYRWALPRAREAGSPHHAAHHDHYETECSPRGFGDVRPDTPRFMQPFSHDAGHWYPRHGQWVEVMT